MPVGETDFEVFDRPDEEIGMEFDVACCDLLFALLSDLDFADLGAIADSLLLLMLLDLLGAVFALPPSFVGLRSFVSWSLLFADFEGAFVADPHIAVAGSTEPLSFSVFSLFFEVCVPPFIAVPFGVAVVVGGCGCGCGGAADVMADAVVGEMGGLSEICGHSSVGENSFFGAGIFQAGFVGTGRTTTELFAEPGAGARGECSWNLATIEGGGGGKPTLDLAKSGW